MTNKQNDSARRSKRRTPKTLEVRRSEDIEKLLASSPASFDAFYVEEPFLIFGDQGVSADPKEGLELHGPINPPTDPIPVGIIGTGDGIYSFQRFLGASRHPVSAGLNAKGKPFNPLSFPPFPGTDHAFQAQFESSPVIQREIPRRIFEQALEPAKAADKLRNVVQLILEQLLTLKDLEPEPSIVAVVLPDCVQKHCAAVGASHRFRRLAMTPAERLERSLQRDRRKGQGLLDIFSTLGEAEPRNDKGYWNLHHALKAHAMATGLPTQIVWQPTLEGAAQNQDPATLAWNFFTALYYKSGRIPWQLQHIPANTCFVGISFYKEAPVGRAPMHTSLAQVFSGHGEGLVLKGGRALIDKNKGDAQPHLLPEDAKNLLDSAIATYMSHHRDSKPERVVVHKSSRFWPEEIRGFEEALTGISRYDLVTLERLGDHFMRLGYEPPLRGTVISLHRQRHVVFTGGYVPHLETYPGRRIPDPLEILEHHGDSTPETLCREILALTKLNWNSCSFASGEPMTLQFARTIGRILAEVPAGGVIQNKYRFYM